MMPSRFDSSFNSLLTERFKALQLKRKIRVIKMKSHTSIATIENTKKIKRQPMRLFYCSNDAVNICSARAMARDNRVQFKTVPYMPLSVSFGEAVVIDLDNLRPPLRLFAESQDLYFVHSYDQQACTLSRLGHHVCRKLETSLQSALQSLFGPLMPLTL